MKTNKIFSALLLLALTTTTRAQITYSITIPDRLPNYDGTYDDFGQGHLFYPNDGEIRYATKEVESANNILLLQR